MKKSILTVTAPHKLVDPAGPIFKPPPARMFVTIVVFNGDSIVGFGYGPAPTGPTSGYHTVGWRGDRPSKANDLDAWPFDRLTPFQLAYCRAWKVDMPDARGKFLADYFPK